jgi:hypothetical protein
MTSAAFCYANPKPDASFRLLPCQSLLRDKHMGTGMGMMLGYSPRKAQAITTTTSVSTPVPLYHASSHPQQHAPSFFSEPLYSVHRLHNRTQIAAWAKTAKPPVPSFRSDGAKSKQVPAIPTCLKPLLLCSGAKYRRQRELCEPPSVVGLAITHSYRS